MGLAADLTYLGTDPNGGDLFTLRHEANSHAMLARDGTVHLVEFDVGGTRLILAANAPTSDKATFQPVLIQIEQSIQFLAN